MAKKYPVGERHWQVYWQFQQRGQTNPVARDKDATAYADNLGLTAEEKTKLAEMFRSLDERRRNKVMAKATREAASWRREPATEKQLAALRRFGTEPKPGLTKGEASRVIFTHSTAAHRIRALVDGAHYAESTMEADFILGRAEEIAERHGIAGQLIAAAAEAAKQKQLSRSRTIAEEATR